jgi:putative SOS response-associated peptidase YedK
MCGRFALSATAAELAAQFEVELGATLAPRYNIAPSQPVLIVRGGDDGRVAALVRWGLVPFWADDPAIGGRLINARAETVASKPAFRAAFRRRRCLVPASGYYEWQARAAGKRPWFIHPMHGAVVAIAGVWERWERDGTVSESCALLTCAANARVRPVHDRMPVLIPPADYARWLDAQATPTALDALLAPAPDASLALHPVAQLVNSPRHDSADCIAPLALAD